MGRVFTISFISGPSVEGERVGEFGCVERDFTQFFSLFLFFSFLFFFHLNDFFFGPFLHWRKKVLHVILASVLGLLIFF